MKSDKELYRQLRGLSCEELWTVEVPAFERASSKERMQRVALIRAVGVVFSAAGTKEQQAEVRAWLRSLLRDPAEKIRRYSMAAIPKIGSGATEEGELLSLLNITTGEREKKSLGSALEKIGGVATLAAVAKEPGLLAQTEQKVKASLAREENPSTVRLDRNLDHCPGLRIHLRCRKGLEKIVRAEVQDFIAKNGKFRLVEVYGCCVVITPIASFSLGDLYRLRCFDTLGFGLGVAKTVDPKKSIEALAKIIASPLTLQLLKAFTEGSFRYRLDYVDKGHQRAAVRDVANRAYALCPEILNDAREAPWSIDLSSTDHGIYVELRPKITPDPRLPFRTDDVWAASHPPLAACMARLAGRVKDEIVWDPFCGSGLELIECALLGGVQSIHGTDLSSEAIAIAEANVAAAKLPNVKSHFTCADFHDFAKIPGLGPQSVTLIITNPPMGRRIRVPNLRGLISDLFQVASQSLKLGGRLIFANPLRMESPDPSLKLQYRQVIDLGGFDCRLEMYFKQATKTV